MRSNATVSVIDHFSRRAAWRSKPPAAARIFFVAGMAAAGCHALYKKLLRTTAGGEES